MTTQSTSEESVDRIVWKAYATQSSIGHDVIVKLPDEARVYALGSILASRAPSLINLINDAVYPKEIDLSTSHLSAIHFKAVLDHIHGALDADPSRLEQNKDFVKMCQLLYTADYCGAQRCKLWAEKILIEEHIPDLDAQDLRHLTEDARAHHADLLYEAASAELAQRAPIEVLRNTSCDVLAEIIDRHVSKRARRVQELAVATETGLLIIYDATTGSNVNCIDTEHQTMHEVIYSFDGSMIASICDDYYIRLWNTDTYKCFRLISDPLSGRINQIAFSRHDKTILASASNDGVCKIYNISTGACIQALRNKVGLCLVAFSLTTDWQLATGDVAGNCKLWSVEDTDSLYLLDTPTDEKIISIVYGPNDLLAVLSGINSVTLWDTGTGSCLHNVSGIDSEINNICFSPDGHNLAWQLRNDGWRLWNILAARSVKEIEHSDNIFENTDFAYSPDGSMIASCCRYRANDSISILNLWDPNSGACVREVSEDLVKATSIAFRPRLPAH